MTYVLKTDRDSSQNSKKKKYSMLRKRNFAL